MTNAMQRIEGSCRCGRLRFAVSGNPVITYACHCRGCQKLTSSAFSLSALFPAAQFEFIAGETEIGGMHDENVQIHCAHCKGWAFTRIAELPDMVSIRPALLDPPDAFPLLVDMERDAALPGVRSGATREFHRAQGRDGFAALAEEYAALLREPPAEARRR